MQHQPCEVVSLRPFCLVAEVKEEIEIELSEHCKKVSVFFLHREHLPVEQTVDENTNVIRWSHPGWEAGIVTMVIAVEGESDKDLVSSVTPILVLPKEAADEMRAFFDSLMEREATSEKLLSSAHEPTELQKSVLQKEFWRQRIRSFAVDLDFLLNDVDENEVEDEDELYEELLEVFKRIYQYLGSVKAYYTMRYLVQACKERGVIPFYSDQYNVEDGKNDSECDACEMARKVTNDDMRCDYENNAVPEASYPYSEYVPSGIVDSETSSSDNDEIEEYQISSFHELQGELEEAPPAAAHYFPGLFVADVSISVADSTMPGFLFGIIVFVCWSCLKAERLWGDVFRADSPT